jgi:hypothetical protein
LRGICPIHKGANNPTGFSVFHDSKEGIWKYKCFSARCGASGDLFSFLHEMKGMDFKEALFHLAGRPMPLPEEQQQRFTPEAKPPSPEELEWKPALDYYGNLGAYVGQQTAYDWWLSQGLDDKTIHRFKVGYSPKCPTFKRSGSFTIPISFCQGTDRKLVGIRHRLTAPPEPNDKYRPHYIGQVATLFGTDTIFYWPDGTERKPEHRQELIICEGEKKLMVACKWGIDEYMSIVTATAGATAWKRDNGRYWAYKLSRFEKVYIVFDPDAEDAAERTAALFGRRGHIVMLDRKMDDVLVEDGDKGFNHLMNAMFEAPAYRERSYWSSVAVE